MSSSESKVSPSHSRRVPLPAIGMVIVLCVVGLAVPAYGSAYTIQFATDIIQAVILAYSWNLLAGYTGYLSFGHVAFFGIGAYATAMLVMHTAVPWYLSVFVGGMVSVAVAVLVGPIMLRLRGILFALGMLGLARIMETIFTDWQFPGGAGGTVISGDLTPVAVYGIMLLTGVAAFAANLFIEKSGFGLDAMSVREDEDAALALGVPTNKVKTLVFALSALFPAIAGGLVAWNRSYIDPPSAFDPTMDLLTIVFVLFGGIGTLWGPLIGAAVLMAVAEVLLVKVPAIKLALYGLIVIVVVLRLPGGVVSLINRLGGHLVRKPVRVPETFPADIERLAPAVSSTALEVVTARPVLQVRDVSVRFGGHVAVNKVSFEVNEGEILCVIGANGAGKTTLFNAITGAVPISEGQISLFGKDITAVPLYGRVHMGIARTFQIPRLLGDLTVWENVLVAARHGRQSHRAAEYSAAVMHILGLEELKLEQAGMLSPGRQRELEIARVLAVQPDVVLLDEVMAGMTRDEQETVRNVIRRFPELGVHAVICVEHVIAAVADLSDRMLVLDFGHKIAHGVPDEVLNDPVVVRSYLGDVA
ncbi:MAG TPA: branched-chain amino acid ABC transporter ATP-binding protein/permease [Castellaniella sp.]|uniref:branched-chain amino acid ABC transporter ATP-binding protein/permease n=1 Tax=Castellaniella sp. TaxID=1955812 RepID=UPI002F03AF70